MTDPSPSPRPDSWTEALVYPLACLGALAGAALGICITWLAARSSFYAMIAVGAFAGLGARMLANLSVKHKDPLVGIMAGVIALAAAIWAQFAIFGELNSGPGFSHFLTHLNELNTMSLIVIAITPFLAFFLAWRK